MPQRRRMPYHLDAGRTMQRIIARMHARRGGGGGWFHSRRSCSYRNQIVSGRSSGSEKFDRRQGNVEEERVAAETFPPT